MVNLTTGGSPGGLDETSFCTHVPLAMKSGIVVCLIVVIDSNEAVLRAEIV